MLRLPLGKHPKTHRFASLLDYNGEEINDTWKVLRTHPLIDTKQIISLTQNEQNLANKIPEPSEAIAPMIQECTLLRGIVEKASKKENLKHTERLALLYTLGHCGDAGRTYIHQVIALCSNYEPRVTERFIQRLEQGHKPISCSKLREWLKDYLPNVSCECPNKKNRSPLDLLSATKKTESKKQSSLVSEKEWEVFAEEFFDFADDAEV